MHNLALDAQRKGNMVTGSDDEIFEPSYSRLKNAGLLPQNMGWDENKITSDTDMVIVGMHTHADNPELAKAQKLGIPIYSYPQYIKEHSQNKKRIVIGGSHGKSSVTSMIMHVLKTLNFDFDYLVGAKVEGFTETIRLTEKAPFIVIEGDEYASAPFDKTPKFLVYQANIAVITGIAWDHINIYPTFEAYKNAFVTFVKNLKENDTLIYCQNDTILEQEIASKVDSKIKSIPYQTHAHEIRNGKTILFSEDKQPFEIQVFGNHNLQNINAAKQVCWLLGIAEKDFLKAIATFTGAGKRLEKVFENQSFIMYKDYAHAPSKVLATTQAVKKQYPQRKLVACLELHTYSSLNTEFLPLYHQTLKEADMAFVYFNPKALAIKRMPNLEKETVKNYFGKENLEVFDDRNLLEKALQNIDYQNTNLLMMSSGTFDGLDFQELAQTLKK
jgi:UDP-N-acetylmuramate: L-alanyl-gamma-D-glutamyl-meso-diaminopimelate ligase